VLGYSGTVMVPLGWIGGVVGLILATAISLYANTLVAKLHEFGGKRHIRYRDLAGFIYGKPALFALSFSIFSVTFTEIFISFSGRKAYCLTWVLQYVNLFMINCGFIILAGSALKVRSKHFSLLILDSVSQKSVMFGVCSVFCRLFMCFLGMIMP